MSTKSRYTYSILRYFHDITTGEFVNVGVAIYVPDAVYVNAKCRKTTQRIKRTFPTFNVESFKNSVKYVESAFRNIQIELNDLAGQLPLDHKPANISELAQRVFNKDDSAFQWSPMGSGLTSDPESTLERLYSRMVSLNDEAASTTRRQDDDVWRKFSTSLQNRNLLDRFHPKTISVQDDEIKFEHAWKNGEWHCLAPVSFDLASSTSIKEKAHKWLGQLASVAESDEPFKVYFLVGNPSDNSLDEAAKSAMGILKKSKLTSVVLSEGETETFSALIEHEIKTHEKNIGQH